MKLYRELPILPDGFGKYEIAIQGGRWYEDPAEAHAVMTDAGLKQISIPATLKRWTQDGPMIESCWALNGKPTHLVAVIETAR